MPKPLTMPTNLILFGITGDLAKKKIIPALYHIHDQGLLPDKFRVIGFSRKNWTNNDLREYVISVLGMHSDIKNPKKETLSSFVNYFVFQQGDFNEKSGYENISSIVNDNENKWKTCSNKLFYLAVSPMHYKTIFDGLSSSHLASHCDDNNGWTRILVEKPFGKDFKTAQNLDMTLGKLFKEEQIYRIDHFVAKEMIQNILAFRFSNSFLENSWNSGMIEKISINFSEKVGVDGRGDFYDGIGALRDIGQNHLLQILALVTMDEPKDFSDKEIRGKKAEILSKLEIPTLSHIKQKTFRAQYDGYKNVKGVKEGSTTETYFKVELFLDSKRWKNVPIILESGKKLGEKDLKVCVEFKEKRGRRNRVVFDLVGEDMGIYIEFWAKKPGLDLEIEKRTLSFSFCENGVACDIAEPYEKLILDCISGNQTLFISTDEIMAMWKFIDPIICAWDSHEVSLATYLPGSDDIRTKPKF